MLDPPPELQDDTPISSVGFSARIQNARAATGLETVGLGAGGVIRYEFQSAGPRKADCDPTFAKHWVCRAARDEVSGQQITSERVTNWAGRSIAQDADVPETRRLPALPAAAWPSGAQAGFKLSGGATKIMATTIFLVALAGCADMRGLVHIEQASAGKSYDYVVHVQNVLSIGYNPEVREDRNRMALRFLKRQCPAGRIFSEDKIITEIWGVTSSPPDYIVLVKCA